MSLSLEASSSHSSISTSAPPPLFASAATFASLIIDDEEIINKYKTCFHPIAKSSISRNGINSDIVVQLFYDQIFVSITQIGKIGSIITGTFETSLHESTKTYEIDTIFGRRDDPLLSIYCRQLIEKALIVDAKQRPVLMSIALCEEGRDSETFQVVVNEVLRIFTDLL